MAQTAGGTYYAASSELVSSWPATSLDLANQLESRFAAKANASALQILQFVRSTNSSYLTTTSTTYTDATGVSITITPTKNTSKILVMAAFNAQQVRTANGSYRARYRITDSSNNAIVGAEGGLYGINASIGSADIESHITLLGWATPATTSAVTYKVRFLSDNASTTAAILGNEVTTTMLAWEIA